MTDRREYSVLGIPVVHDANDGFAHSIKQGHKCCGGCCDMRRGVIIVNIVMIGLCVLALPFMILSYDVISHPEQFSDDLDDEEKKAFSDAKQSLSIPLGFLIFLLVAKMACYSCGIYGALKFNSALVGVSLAAYCLTFIMALFSANIILMLLPGFFAYPHVFFIKEVRQGMMSEDNYELEKQSCCCV